MVVDFVEQHGAQKQKWDQRRQPATECDPAAETFKERTEKRKWEKQREILRAAPAGAHEECSEVVWRRTHLLTAI